MGLFLISMLAIAYIALVPIRILLQAAFRLFPTARPQSNTPFGSISSALKEDIVAGFEKSLLSELTDRSFLEHAQLRSYSKDQWIYPNKDPGIMLVIPKATTPTLYH